jgi:chemotaxis protein histidine kinase CheA
MAELTKEQVETIESLRRAFRERLPHRVEEVVAAAGDLLGPGEWERPKLEALFHLVHRLTGSSGIYGFTRMSHEAGALEALVTRALEENLPATAPLRAELRRLVLTLSQTGAEDAPLQKAEGTKSEG